MEGIPSDCVNGCVPWRPLSFRQGWEELEQGEEKKNKIRRRSSIRGRLSEMRKGKWNIIRRRRWRTGVIDGRTLIRQRRRRRTKNRRTIRIRINGTARNNSMQEVPSSEANTLSDSQEFTAFYGFIAVFTRGRGSGPYPEPDESSQPTNSRGMGHAVSRLPLTTEAQFAPASLHVGFVVDKVALGQLLGCPLSISFHHGTPFSYIIWGMNSRPVGGCSSETVSSRQREHLTPCSRALPQKQTDSTLG
jgi:hypothetical protein